MVHQHVDQVLEEAGLAGTEEALRDLQDGLLQLRKTVVVGQSIVAERRGDMEALLGLVSTTIFIVWTIKIVCHLKEKLYRLYCENRLDSTSTLCCMASPGKPLKHQPLWNSVASLMTSVKSSHNTALIKVKTYK